MPTKTPHVGLSPGVRIFALSLAAFALAGGCLSFLGWALDIFRLTDWFDRGISIQPNSTLAVMAGGASVLCLVMGHPRLAAIPGMVSLFFGAATLFQMFSGVNLGTDELFLFGRPWGNTATVSPGRMGLPGSVCFTLLGLAALVVGRGARGRKATVVLALAATCLATLSVLGYLYHANQLYTLPRYTAIALQNSIMIIAIGLGLVATQTDQPPMRIVMENSGAGLLVRRALPIIILVPILLAWLRTLGEEAGLFDAGMGRSLLILLLLFIMIGGLWWIVRPLARHESELREAQARQALLAEVGQQFGRGEDAGATLGMVCRQVARHFGVSRAGYSRVDQESRRITIEHDYAEAGMTPLEGVFPLAEDSGFSQQEANGRQETVVSDLSSRPARREENERFFPPPGARAILVIPLVRGGQWVADFWLTHHEARPWSAADVTLMRTLADRVQAAVENWEFIRQLQRANVQLLQASRMEALGRLAGGLAHDFNNQLQAMSGFASFIQRDPDVQNQSRRDLEQIQKSVERIASLIRQLLAFSRQQVLITEVIELGSAVVDSLTLLRQFLGPTIELRVETGQQPLWVKVDRSQFHQVLVNLIINARDAMPEGGTVTITVVPVDGSELARSWRGVAPGSYSCLSVSDTGVGVAEADLPYIFEPFFTTKALGQGTGLGLATVHGIVSQSGGHIDVRSEPGAGASFRVLLPLTEEPAPTPARPPAGPMAGRAGSRILVVDDEPMIRDILVRSLQSSGYNVTAASNGSEAITCLEGAAFDLVISDVVMPVMGGAELGRIMARRFPDLPLILISGFPLDASFTAAERPPMFLPKPVRIEELLSAVAGRIGGLTTARE